MADDTRQQLLVMIDPAWRPEHEGDTPPVEAVLGGWRTGAAGVAGRFEPNPRYRPTEPDSPSDPADAVVRLVVRGDADGDRLLAVLDDVYLGVAVDERGAAVITPSPDGVPSVLVATAPAHRTRVDVPGWLDNVTLRDLAGVLPADGVDVLINPGASFSMRVRTSSITEYVARPADGADVK